MDMNDVKGQEHVKRGLEVAAAGNHSVLLIGPPGSGKTMLATRLFTITDEPVIVIKDITGSKVSMSSNRIDKALFDTSAKIIITTMYPCPCGFFTDPKKECHCTPYQIQRHLAKIPGQFLDRIDIHLNVPRLNFKELTGRRKGDPSEIVKARIKAAKKVQVKRFYPAEVIRNANLRMVDIEKYCVLDKEAEELLKMAILELGISIKAYDKILKVARTISDLEEKQSIEACHISEAISYRSLDRDFWM